MTTALLADYTTIYQNEKREQILEQYSTITYLISIIHFFAFLILKNSIAPDGKKHSLRQRNLIEVNL